jgi:hypothetical protein
VALLALEHVFPSLRWAWRHQEPLWVIALAAAWIAGGVALIALRRQTGASALVLLGLAVSVPFALAASRDVEMDYAWWWFGDRMTLGWLDIASLIAAALGGWQLGRAAHPPHHVVVAKTAAVVSSVVAAVLLIAAFASGALVGLAGEEGSQLPVYIGFLVLAQMGCVVAGISVARATLGRHGHAARSGRIPRTAPA